MSRERGRTSRTWPGRTRARRHPLAPVLVLALALLATGATYALLAPSAPAQAAAGIAAQSADEGRRLFLANCSTCHGINAEGSSDGPSLIGVGAAAVDFQVGTSRMPARQPGPQIIKSRKVVFSQDEIDAMAAYVASLGPGPAVPPDEAVDPAKGDLTGGGELFRTNCASCHNSSGKGGALPNGKFAPGLDGVTPRHIYEAMLTGPQQMPVFNDRTVSPEEKRDIVAFLKKIEGQADPGGLALGRIGPVSEGLFGWLVGLGLLIAAAVWLGAKSA